MTQPAKPHRSPSAMASYFRCGEAFRRLYIEKERPPPVVAMLKGTGVHRGAAVNFEQKIVSKLDLPVAQIIAAAVDGFDQEIAKSGVTLSDEEKAIGKDIVIGEARDDVARMAAAHAIAQAPDYQPVAVEKTVRIPVPRGTHDLVGVMDLVSEDELRRRTVADFKTAKRRKRQTEAAESIQLSFYAAAHQVEYGKPPDEVRLDILVQTSKGVQRQVLSETRDQKDFQVLANQINVMQAGVEKGVFLPAIPGSWWCSSRFCSYHASCPYVNAERIAAADDSGE